MVVKKNSKLIIKLEAHVADLRERVERQSHMNNRSMFYHMEDTAKELSRVTEQLLIEYRKCL